MTLLHTTPRPAAEIQLSPVELARIDYHAVDGYQGGVFPPDLVAATAEKTGLILQAEIASIGEEPEIPRWVLDYRDRDFEPLPQELDTTLDERGWALAMLASASGQVVSEQMMADMARASYDDMRHTIGLRNNRPRLTTPEARVVRVALGWRALTAADPIAGLEANIARSRYLNISYGPMDFLANSGQNATRTFRRIASLAF